MVKTAPYGTWESPITADAITTGAATLEETVVDPVTSTIYHVERRSSEGGRSVLVKSETGKDLFGEGWNCRTGVQEYGGAAARAYGGVIYFSNFKDGRVYSLKEGEEPEPVTPENSVHRFADFAVHPVHSHLIVSILEDHTNPNPADVKTSLCVINVKTKSVHSFVSGADFYASPAFSPDGNSVVWQQWNHPDMPWEGGEIHTGKVKYDANTDTLSVSDAVHVAGKHKEISASHPFWISNNVFVFTADVSGFQNPWTYTLSTGKAAPILPSPQRDDFSLPAWLLGNAFGAVAHPGDDTNHTTLIFAGFREGRARLYLLTLHSGAIEELESPYVEIWSVRRIADGSFVFLGTRVDEDDNIILCNLKDYSKPHFKKLKAKEDKFSKSLYSQPRSITLNIPPNNEPLYVMYYPPTNPEYQAPEGELPPAIVRAHGGPTDHEKQGLAMLVQYFTSRGFAWIGVDYGGSSGHGRTYIERLKGTWGVVDARDCVLAAEGLSKAPHNLADPKRIALRGGSAGGYTVLQTLCEYPHAFTVGTSLYGISDLKKLAEFTHKYESQYMAKLLGGFLEDIPEVYKERSPVHNAHKIRSPLLIEQGLLDAAVPPVQAEDMIKSIKANGGHVDYVVFPDEGHGWRKAENIKTSLEKELQFYEQIFKLKGTAAL